jgi:hypothetical protein
MQRKTALFILLLPQICVSLLGQDSAGKTQLFVSCSCDDQLGAKYATALRDIVAKSPRYEETRNEGDDKSGYPFKISLVSIDTSTSPGEQIAISEVTSFNSILFDQNVQVCSAQSVFNCAQTTFSQVDKSIDELKKALSKTPK